MIAYFYDRTSLRTVAVLSNAVDASVTLTHDSVGTAQLTYYLDDPQVMPLTTGTLQRFNLSRLLRAQELFFVVIRDARGRLRMQGRASMEVSGDKLLVRVSDLLDELRLFSLPPLRHFNGSVTDIIHQILDYAPPGKRRQDLPDGVAVVDESWSLGDVTYAINSWTTLDGSRMNLLEAISAVCEQTGNHFRLISNGTRKIHIQKNPPDDGVEINIVKGGFHPTLQATSNVPIVGEPSFSVEDDTILAGIYPEGGGFRTTDNIDKVLRLAGDEIVPDGYRLESVNGYWGVFNAALVGDPVTSAVPLGVIRSESLGTVVPLTNTEESVSALLEEVSGSTIRSAAFAGYPVDYWKDGTASFADSEATVTGSFNDVVTLSAPLTGAEVDDIVDVSVSREWDEDLVTDARQSLAGVAVAMLDAHKQPQVSWSVRIKETEARLFPGARARLMYSGNVRWKGAAGAASDHVVPTMTVNESFFVQELTISVENDEEYYNLVLVDDLYVFPSNSGLREIMAYVQRRFPGARMGREGASYTEQYIVTCDVAGGCSDGSFLGATLFDIPFRTEPRVVEVKPLNTDAVVSVTTSTVRISACASRACDVRVSIVPTERVPA